MHASVNFRKQWFVILQTTQTGSQLACDFCYPQCYWVRRPHPRGSVGREPRLFLEPWRAIMFWDSRDDFTSAVWVKKNSSLWPASVWINLMSKMSELWLCFPCCVTEQPPPVDRICSSFLSLVRLTISSIQYCNPKTEHFLFICRKDEE